jgi:hypothetical protein
MNLCAPPGRACEDSFAGSARDTRLVLGPVLAMHVREDVTIDAAKHYIDPPRLRLIGRMQSGWYTIFEPVSSEPHFPRRLQAHQDSGDQSHPGLADLRNRAWCPRIDAISE